MGQPPYKWGNRPTNGATALQMGQPPYKWETSPTRATNANQRQSITNLRSYHMAKITKKLQANTLRLIALNRVSLDSFTLNGEPSPDATLTHVANIIDTIPFSKNIGSKQVPHVRVLPSNKVVLTDISVSPDGSETATREIVLTLVGIGSYEFLNCL